MTYYCFNCGSTDIRSFMGTETIACIDCEDCGCRYNVDNISGDLDF